MIYEAAEDSFLLAEQVKKYACGSVLDVGTGSGIQAETAASLKSVKSVLATDISDEVIKFFKNKIKKNKIKIKKSDLFSNIKGKFDTIIFNPPYLPRDRREAKDSALATTGGKHGYETLERFLLSINDNLNSNGICLILFSSLTNKNKIDEILNSIGYDFEELSTKKISFETLYVYKLKRNWLMDELFKKKVKNIKKLAKGHRGLIYTGKFRGKKIAIKAQRLDLKVRTVDREAEVIKKLNKKGLAPKILFKGKNYFAYNFAEGEFILDFLEHSKKLETKKVFLETLRQCRTLDKMKITKEEMHNPWKHVIVGKKVILLDFERAHYDPTPKNISQFCQYLMRNQKILGEKGIQFKKEDVIELSRKYKNNQTEANYNKIKSFLYNT